ncbi:PEP/pyruvate-binding domain-containing protein, partial [Candidatus Woesearchaeota archaeon]|nr:PEP/pyruvate-binding domain-containing protein [Candidatus Woesearchaeota archaeon]
MNPKNYIQKYGGKGNGLIWLAENTDLGYTVPEFKIIDTSFYEECLKQELLAQLASQIYQLHNPDEKVTSRVERIPKRLEEKCRELSREFKGRAVSVRSSAVVSEDSDRFSGAGIYDTFFLSEEELNEKTLQEAVLKVYDSVNSPRAVKYRQEAGLKDERMAVVVQEINHEFSAYHGVMQSRLQDVSHIIPVSFSEDIGAVVSGDPNSKINTVYFKKRFYEEPIRYKIAFANDNLKQYIADNVEKLILPLILKLKKRYGRDFEAEFSAKLSHNNTGRIDLLQIRPLTNISDKKIRFPKKKPIFTT